MNLTDAQKHNVAAWIEEGLKLAEIQKKLAAECGVHLTYIETRLLIGDLQLTPKDEPVEEAPKPAEEAAPLVPTLLDDAASPAAAGWIP